VSEECPTCGKRLATEQGVRIHHTQTHDEPLPNRVCDGCGFEFYDSQARREYCDDCNLNAAEHNGNWRGAKETTTCERCGSAFEYYPSNKDGVYCADCVAESEEFLGDSYVKDAEWVTKECEQCDEPMEILQSRIERGEGRFCSLGCVGDWLSDNIVGEQHHQWKEGETLYRGDWWSARRRARERDNYECRVCGMDSSKLNRELDVHHIRPIREFDDPQESHTLDNVITLCRSCHRKAEVGNISVPDPTDER